MFCTKCGRFIQDNAKFCTGCGHPVASGRVGQTARQAGTQQTESRQAEAQPQTCAPQPRDGHKKLIISIVAGIVLLLCAAAVTLALLYRMGEEQWKKAESAMRLEAAKRAEADLAAMETDRSEAQEETQPAQTEAAALPQASPVDILIRQIDNADFPNMTFYASVTDENGEAVEELKSSDFIVQELQADGSMSEVALKEVYQVLDSDRVYLNLVLDISGSMSDNNKIGQAKAAAQTFLGKVDFDKGDEVELVTFDDFVYLTQEFTDDYSALSQAVDEIAPGGSTALYDALYVGLQQTYYQDNGAKCVIGFTDGRENASSYSLDDIVAMAQNTGIPVYIIGIGEEYDADELAELAEQCSGRYYSANADELESILQDIYTSIYQEQQASYAFQYTSGQTADTQGLRQLRIETSAESAYAGSAEKEFVPMADMSGAFSREYLELDYLLEDSNVREITDADLEDFSLAQLRIARNEIFARHGRQFKDPMLNQWFYSRDWYLEMPVKYTPEAFEKLRPSPLGKLEIANTEVIKKYEENRIASEDIYPDACSRKLSEYDLALSREVLKRALEQVRRYPAGSVRDANLALIEEAIDREEIQY